MAVDVQLFMDFFGSGRFTYSLSYTHYNEPLYKRQTRKEAALGGLFLVNDLYA